MNDFATLRGEHKSKKDKMKMKKNRVILSALSLAAAFAAVAVHDLNGYNFLDRAGKKNALCQIDPSCRTLKDSEKEMARDIFGDTVNYDRVKIFNRPLLLWFLRKNATAVMWGGNIYILSNSLRVDDFTKADKSAQRAFIHEMTHVWQYSNDPKFLARGLLSFMLNDFNYDVLYNYRIEDHLKLESFNIEQQAEIVADYYEKRLQFREATKDLTLDKPANFSRHFNVWARGACKELDRYAEVISYSIPQKKEPGCAMYRPYEVPNINFDKSRM